MKSHRGLSSVVGAVFLIAIVIGALTYVSSSLETMANFSEQLVTEESRLKEQQKESFDIASMEITAANKLNAVIKNTGEIPLKITNLYIDEIGVNDVVNKTTINKTISPGKSFDFLTESIDIDINPLKGYTVKLVTSRGDTKTFNLNTAGQESLDIQLIATPDVIPSGFSSTIMMIVNNNMTTNNSLLNLTPVSPLDCGLDPDCDSSTGPFPASYDSLDTGDIAIFRWVYKLSGDEDDTFVFTGSLQNGIPGNTDTETVTIGVPPLSVTAGQAITSLGLGQSILNDDVLVFHSVNSGIPDGADHQMATRAPDLSGIPLVFDSTDDVVQFFSGNATVQDIDISAGVWNASLRYNNPRLPTAMDLEDDKIWKPLGYMHSAGVGGGHIFHFNDASDNMYDSVTETACSGLTHTAIGATWGSTLGVNGTGAYSFDGVGDYLRIANSGTKLVCNYTDKLPYSIAGWFKATSGASDNTQHIFGVTHNDGDILLELGDGTAGNKGELILTHQPKTGSPAKPNVNTDLMDDNWHHFVATCTETSDCYLYLDGALADTDNASNNDHLHYTADLFIGAKDSSNTNPFTGVIDDIMFWQNHTLSSTDVTALYQTSFGSNATQLNFVLNNATGDGTTVNNIFTTTNYPLPYVDIGRYTSVNDLYIGANFTKFVNSPVGLNVVTENRLNFTISYAGGLPMNFWLDDQDLHGSGSTKLSSYLQVPTTPDPLPVFYDHNKFSKVTFFAFNAGDDGAWFTFQGTRVVFNGTNGNYAGVVDTVNNGVDPIIRLNATQDGPFISGSQSADVVFWQPQKSPWAGVPPSNDDYIPVGSYSVSIFLNGYDENGVVFLRNISLGTVKVVE